MFASVVDVRIRSRQKHQTKRYSKSAHSSIPAQTTQNTKNTKSTPIHTAHQTIKSSLNHNFPALSSKVHNRHQHDSNNSSSSKKASNSAVDNPSEPHHPDSARTGSGPAVDVSAKRDVNKSSEIKTKGDINRLLIAEKICFPMSNLGEIGLLLAHGILTLNNSDNPDNPDR